MGQMRPTEIVSAKPVMRTAGSGVEDGPCRAGAMDFYEPAGTVYFVRSSLERWGSNQPHRLVAYFKNVQCL
jgi:hypothetical protein